MNAKERYQALRNKFLNVTSDNEISNLMNNKTLTNFGMTDQQANCLAISRDFICASEFPKCKNNETTESPMCGFYCQLWLDRCPEVSVINLTSFRKKIHTISFAIQPQKTLCAPAHSVLWTASH